MNSSAVQLAPEQKQVRISRWDSFRLIPRLETYPVVVRAAQTVAGKLVMLALFGWALSSFLHTAAYVITVMLALTTFLPRYRRILLFICTLATVYLFGIHSSPRPWLLTAQYLSCFVLGGALYWIARKYPRSAFGRRPILFLLIGYAALFVAGSFVPRNVELHAMLWNFIAVFSDYVWFIGYALMDRSASAEKDLPFQWGTFRPFWGSTSTPFPKGAAYLRKIEAKSPEELAIAQLKGLKLLVWAVALAFLSQFWDRFWHVFLGIPNLKQALLASAAGVRIPVEICWLSTILGFFESIFWVSILGHRIIACCRMAGFRALRNTYRPLSSVTVQEFFNRFYYYYKELLVDFFFYPTFLRYFKKHPRIRLAAATFAAACLGNAFYHLTLDWRAIYEQGIATELVNFSPFILYSAILGAGLCVSQARQRPRRTGFLRSRLWPMCCVVLFYSLINIFASEVAPVSLMQHFRFLGHMFYLV